ncbi:GrpB family protein [Motilimonas sp. KMU-193]|uniref:GrpB family protein n=1 Tax=Motilimonas sp. KMU-193 TaxID=3388668 RepID=UPI00396B414B
MSLRIIEVVDFQPSWADYFNREKALICNALSRENVVGVHHIGSTSVEGLCAKPIIDILLEVKCLSALDEQSRLMGSLGYLAKGEFGIPGRRYFQKGVSQRTHQVHAFLTGSHEAKRHIAFKEYLIAFPEVADEYGVLKKAGAKICNNDIDVYCSHKDSFIKEHEAKALNWKMAYTQT